MIMHSTPRARIGHAHMSRALQRLPHRNNTIAARSSQPRALRPTRSMATLISFDVDGTLIHSVGLQANKLHKDAFAAGFK